VLGIQKARAPAENFCHFADQIAGHKLRAVVGRLLTLNYDKTDRAFVHFVCVFVRRIWGKGRAGLVFAQRGWLDAAAVAGVAFCQHVVQREKLRACAPRNVRRPLGPKTNEKEMKKKHPPADAAS